jgi:UDPglucose--hexose-1-phosphate uridylyltransferase
MQGSPRFHPLAHHGHWMLRILPRLNGIAGFEWGTGMLINTVAPEAAAEELRG